MLSRLIIGGEAMAYGMMIRDFRARLGLSQEQLGDQIGVSRSAVYDWESEKYPPTDAKKIAALERVFGLETGHIYNLIYGNPPQTSGSRIQETAV